MSRFWYFAYGSNMETATFCGRRRIEYRRAVPGRVLGYRLVVDKPPLFPVGESFANLLADPAGEVLGVLYEVGDAELAHIDLTEGVPIGNYRWIDVPAAPLVAPDEICQAKTLISEKSDPSLRPSRRYMACLIAGALEHGLPPEYVESLRAIDACEESEESRRIRPHMDRFFARRGGDAK